MKRSLLVFLLAGMSMLFISAFTVYKSHKYSGGKFFSTGSPYDGGSCGLASNGCHSGGASIPTVTVTASPSFGSGNMYTPGTTYTVNVICSGTYPKYGFDLEILDSQTTSALDAGTFGSPVSSNCQVDMNPGFPSNASHLTPSNAAFSFTWTAPAGGNAYLYCAGLGVNMSGTNSGDRDKTFSMTLTPAGTGVPSLAQSNFNLNVFPNPVSDKMKISYALEGASIVTLKLFDLNGTVAAELLSDFQYAGRQSKTFSLPDGLPGGVYLLKLTVDGQEAAKKIIVR